MISILFSSAISARGCFTVTKEGNLVSVTFTGLIMFPLRATYEATSAALKSFSSVISSV